MTTERRSGSWREGRVWWRAAVLAVALAAGACGSVGTKTPPDGGGTGGASSAGGTTGSAGATGAGGVTGTGGKSGTGGAGGANGTGGMSGGGGAGGAGGGGGPCVIGTSQIGNCILQ
jgi:hypothetical protein